MFPSWWEVAGGVNFVVNVKESVLSPWTKVFKAIYSEGVMSGGFSLHFINGNLKFHDGKWFICFI